MSSTLDLTRWAAGQFTRPTVYSFKLCIGSAMYICTLRCTAELHRAPLPPPTATFQNTCRTRCSRLRRHRLHHVAHRARFQRVLDLRQHLVIMLCLAPALPRKAWWQARSGLLFELLQKFLQLEPHGQLTLLSRKRAANLCEIPERGW